MIEPLVIRLESDALQVILLPANGGKIADIVCRRTGASFLLQGSKQNRVAAFSPLDPFEKSDCAGWDECLPSISISGPDTPGGGVSDHGDFWRLPWKVLQHSEYEVTIQASGYSRPFLFTRRFRLKGAELELQYCIENRSSRGQPYLYASHPLFAVDAGDRIVLPAENRWVKLHYSREDRLVGKQVSWPIANAQSGEVKLDVVGGCEDRTAEMLYTGRVKKGVCGIYRNKYYQGIQMRFNPVELPYLGLWLCYGGWPDGSQPKQYAVSLEPTVAPYGALSQAIAMEAAPSIPAHGMVNFSIRINIAGSEEDISYERFSRLCEG